MQLLADNDINFSLTGSIDTESSNPTVTLTADADSTSGGGIAMDDGSFVDATDGLIDIDATDNIVISLLQTTTDVAVDSSAASILDNVSDTTDVQDIIAANALLNGATGIGTTGNPLETTLAKLEGNGVSGGIFVDDTGGLVIGTITGSGLPAASSNTGLSATGNIRVTTHGLHDGQRNCQCHRGRGTPDNRFRECCPRRFADR